MSKTGVFGESRYLESILNDKQCLKLGPKGFPQERMLQTFTVLLSQHNGRVCTEPPIAIG